MPKATIKLPNGTIIDFSGSADELHQLASLFSAQSERIEKSPTMRTESVRRNNGPKGTVVTGLRDLKEHGFFSKKKVSIDDIAKALNEGGHYFRGAAIATALLRLVKRHELRRLKEGGKWLYTFS